MGQIIGNLGQAKTYKAQASVALAQGRAQKAAASKRAFNLEEEARSDSILAGKNMMRQRENQTAAQATVRNAIASSGFTSQGSGQQAEIATADIFETAIRDMALSNAISDSNKRYAADVSRYQGDLAMQQAEAAASQYNSLAKRPGHPRSFRASDPWERVPLATRWATSRRIPSRAKRPPCRGGKARRPRTATPMTSPVPCCNGHPVQ